MDIRFVCRYPCCVAVSRPMFFLSPCDRPALVSYICAVVDAAAATVQSLEMVVTKKGTKVVLRSVDSPFSLKAHHVFLKPVTPRQFAQGSTSDHQMSFASKVLSIFHALDTGGAGKFVCSPVGMVSLPPEGDAMRADMLKALRCQGMWGSAF